MKKLLSGLGSTSLALAVAGTGITPTIAASLVPNEPVAAPAPGIIRVQDSYDDVLRKRRERINEEIGRRNPREERGEERRERREDRREVRRERQEDWREAQQERREARQEWREARRERREEWREGRRDRREARWDRDERSGYYRGYRGYREYRPGYRRYDDGFWYPAAAFAAGALITGAIANAQPREVIVEGGSHVEWCANRYRSYRAHDNTFQPYNGPRQQCISPYD